MELEQIMLHSRILGEQGSPHLVIMHGLLGSADNWQTLAKKYAENFQVHLIDARNHGRSPKSDIHSYDAMVGDLLKYLDDKGIQKAYLLGHSMGGKTVMAFAELHPDRVKRLIVADIAPRAYTPHHGPIFDALKVTYPEKASSRKEVLYILEERLSNQQVLLSFLMKSLKRNKKGGYSWRFNVDVLCDNLKEITRKIELSINTLPALYLRGLKSDYINDADLAGLEKVYLQLETDSLDQSGHWLHAEQPEEFFDVTSEFLDD